MNENREESTKSIRETYATPTYERFVFEASGLAMTSEPVEPRPASMNGVVGFFYQDEEAVGVYSRN